MNKNSKQHDAELEALSKRGLSPRLEAMLDDALEAEAAPRELVDRIFNATRHHVQRQAFRLSDYLRSVWWTRAAALVNVAAGLGIVFTATLIFNGARTLASFSYEVSRTAQHMGSYQSPSTDLDQQIKSLALDMGSVGMDEHWDSPAVRQSMISGLRDLERAVTTPESSRVF